MVKDITPNCGRILCIPFRFYEQQYCHPEDEAAEEDS